MIKFAKWNPPYQAHIYYQYIGKNIHESREFRSQGDFKIEINPSPFYNWDNEVLIIKDLGLSIERQVSFSVASGRVWIKQPNLEHPNGKFQTLGVTFEDDQNATVHEILRISQNPVGGIFLSDHYRLLMEIHERRSYESLYDHIRGLNQYPNLQNIRTLF